MSEDKEELSFDFINPNEIIIFCNYGAGKYAFPHKRKEAKELFSKTIPFIKTERDKSVSVFYPINELRIKREAPKLYEGYKGKKAMQENGMGFHYNYMGRIDKKGKHIKKLHEIVKHNIDRIKVFNKCEIIWGEFDGNISSSIHKFKPFDELKDWKKLEISPEIEKKSYEILKKKSDEAIKSLKEDFGI